MERLSVYLLKTCINLEGILQMLDLILKNTFQ